MCEINYAESGVVSLGLISLTSVHEEVRGAGALLLRHVVSKMDKSRYSMLLCTVVIFF